MVNPNGLSRHSELHHLMHRIRRAGTAIQGVG
jgi:hypothetical protein